MTRLALAVVSISCMMAGFGGCADSTPAKTSDTITSDAGVDASADSGVDASSDAGSDATSPDTSPDVSSDAGGDAGGDMGGDAGGDAGGDTSEPGPNECRADMDCDPNGPGLYCSFPGPWWGACGVPCFVDTKCSTDADCTVAGLPVCLSLVNSCCGLSDERSTRCAPACDASTCAPGWACLTATSGCDPVSCDAGYSCPYGTACDTASAPPPPVECGYSSCPDIPIFHGCIRNMCTNDADCLGGHCVLGGCYETFGTCESPVP